jgi:hypothetical protein
MGVNKNSNFKIQNSEKIQVSRINGARLAPGAATSGVQLSPDLNPKRASKSLIWQGGAAAPPKSKPSAGW